MLQATIPELIGTSARDLAPRTQEDRSLAKEAINRVGRQGHVLFEHRFQHASGVVRPVEISSRRIDSRLGIVLSMVRDISDRKKAQESLRKSEERLNAIIESMEDAAVTMLDRQARFQFVHLPAVFRRQMRTSPARMLGKTLGQVFPPAQARARLAAVRKVLRTGKPAYKEHALERGRSTLWHESSLFPMHDEAGKVTGVLVVSRDVTQRRQASDALRESERRMRLVLEHSTDGINITEFNPQTGERRLILCNDQYVEMHGRTREELMRADNVNRFGVPEAESSRDRARRRRVLLSGKPIGGTSSWLRPDGKENHFEWRAAPFKVGKKLFIVGVDRDVTRRRQQQQALEEAQAKLTTAQEEERQRLAGELHDSLGQTLVALQMAISGLAGDGGTAPGAIAQTARKASDLVEHLIGDVRTICQGLYPLTLESMGLRSALMQLSRDFDQGKVQILWRLKEQSARFSRTAEIALFRIAQEALSNAVRHPQADRIRVTLDYRDERVILTVADNGGGFDVEQAVGKGLGLSKMRERAEKAGGQLSITSGPRGTRVRASVTTELRIPNS